MTMSSSSFMRQLSGKEGWKSTSKRWGGGGGGNWKQMEAGFNNMCGGGNGYNGGLVMRKRVMVVVDQSSHTKHAMMWALTHVTNKGDILTLLHIVPHSSSSSSSHCANNKGFSSDSSSSSAAHLASSLGSLCKACKPEVSPAGTPFWVSSHYALKLHLSFCRYYASVLCFSLPIYFFIYINENVFICTLKHP